MQGPTHQFCPNCNAMLPPHLEECPRCGTDLTSPNANLSFRDIFQLTGMVVLIAIVPFVILIGVGVICVMTMR